MIIIYDTATLEKNKCSKQLQVYGVMILGVKPQ